MKNVLILIFVLMYNNSYTQQISPDAVTSSGASMSQSNGSVSFTVGEITVKTITDGTYTISQGFTNTAAQTTTVTAIQETKSDVLKLSIYPNPASALVFVDILHSKLPFIRLTINDIQGRLISEERYATSNNNHIGINIQDWNPGTYLLYFADLQGDLLGSYKIVKE
jgi:hypothetical protein